MTSYLFDGVQHLGDAPLDRGVADRGVRHDVDDDPLPEAVLKIELTHQT